MTTQRTTDDLMQSAIKIDCDMYGNPRYYFPKFVWPDMDQKTRLSAGLNMYRGKRYGAGYVMQSYNLRADIDYALYAIQFDV